MTATITQTGTASVTDTITITATQTITETITIISTDTITATQTITGTMTITATQTITATYTMTPTALPTQAPFSFKLITNYPNPFRENTYILYELGRSADIKVRIYTISGERTAEINGTGMRGKNRIRWNARNKNGKEVSSGVYIYSIEAISGDERAIAWSKLAVVR